MVITMATVVGTNSKSHANRSNSNSNLLVSRKGTLNRMEESFATADTASMTAESSSESSVSNSEADNLYGYGEGSPDCAAFTSPVKVPFPKSTNKNQQQQQQQQQQQHRLPPPQRIRSRRASFNDLPPPGFAGSGETSNFLEEYMKMAAVDETNDDDDESDDGMLSHLLSKSRTPVRRRSSMPFSLSNSGDLSDAIASAAVDNSSETSVAKTKKKQRESPRKSKQDELGMALKSDAKNGIDFSSRDCPRRPNSFDGYDNPKGRTFSEGADVLPNSPPFMSPTTMKKQSAEIERIDRRPSYANSSSTRISRSSQYLSGEEEIVFGDDDESTGKKYFESSEKSYSTPVIFSPTQYRRSKAFNGDDESSSSFHNNANRSDRHYWDSSSRSNLATSNRHYLDSSRKSFVSTNRSSFEFSSRSSLESSFRNPLDSSSKSLLASSFRGPLDSSTKSVLASSSRSYISVQSRDPGMHKSTMPQFVYSVKYKRGTSNAILGPELSRRSGDLPIGTYVKVQGDRGLNLGIVVGKISLHKYNPSEEEEQVQNLKKVVALANQEEVSAVPEIREEEKELLQLCRRMVFQMGLPMTVVDAELQFDREKITFYYESERRVDHRGLVRWLYSILGIRIWMCQTFKPPPRPFSQYGKGKGKQPVEPSAPIIAPVSEWSS